MIHLVLSLEREDEQKMTGYSLLLLDVLLETLLFLFMCRYVMIGYYILVC